MPRVFTTVVRDATDCRCVERTFRGQPSVAQMKLYSPTGNDVLRARGDQRGKISAHLSRALPASGRWWTRMAAGASPEFGRWQSFTFDFDLIA